MEKRVRGTAREGERGGKGKKRREEKREEKERQKVEGKLGDIREKVCTLYGL